MDLLYFFIPFGLLVLLPLWLLLKYGNALDRYVLVWRARKAKPADNRLLRQRERQSRDERAGEDGSHGGWFDGGGGFGGGDGGGG